MGKNQVPRGSTRREPCSKCGRSMNHFFRGSSTKLSTICTTCQPEDQSKKSKVVRK